MGFVGSKGLQALFSDSSRLTRYQVFELVNFLMRNGLHPECQHFLPIRFYPHLQLNEKTDPWFPCDLSPRSSLTLHQLRKRKIDYINSKGIRLDQYFWSFTCL